MQDARTVRVFRLAAVCVAMAAFGCGINHAPILVGIVDQNAAVAVELTIQLRATDADNDGLSFSFACADLPGLAQRTPPAYIENIANGAAIFHYTPIATDSRSDPYQFIFSVTDGKATAAQYVDITVSDEGGNTAPIFVKPLGSGTTLELDTSPCLTLALEVNDTNSAMVTFGQEPPLIDGATIESTGPLTGSWKWCPTAAQVQTSDRFYLKLSADDGKSPKTLKGSYLIVVVGSGKGENCPGAAPVITYTPIPAQNTVQDLQITFSASDDIGLKSTPFLYWATADPGTPPSLAMMMPVATTRTSGNAQSGMYTGVIPNPVASAAAGTQETVYYQIIAHDNDDPTGGCNHTTDDPDGSTFQVVVTAGGSGGLAPCSACTSDAQCGGANDNCITIGGASFCGAACDSGCPSGYVCTNAAVASVNGASATQCIPTSGSCQSSIACTDDNLEQNDSISTITNATSANLTGTSYPNLMMCPLPDDSGVDEDWYRIPVTQEGAIQVSITSSQTATDLDLELTDGMGSPLDYSVSFTSNETVSACVGTAVGQVYARVYSYTQMPQPASYALSVAQTAMSCPCQPDALEPNDNASQATSLGHPVSPTTATYTGLTLCAGNTDWFSVTLNAGDMLTVDLTFTQVDDSGDLDIHLFKPDGTTDLTPCSPTSPSTCMINNGQGYMSNEHFTYTAAGGQQGVYYVVVQGYDSTDSNNYSIAVTTQ